MLDPQYFKDHQGKKLSVSAGSVAINAKVVEVTQMAQLEGQERPRFSVIIEGPAQPLLEQQIYAFDFPDGQQHHLFMVPLGPRGDAMRYELVFT